MGAKEKKLSLEHTSGHRWLMKYSWFIREELSAYKAQVIHSAKHLSQEHTGFAFIKQIAHWLPIWHLSRSDNNLSIFSRSLYRSIYQTPATD